MGLSRKAIEELKETYREVYGQDLADQEAWDIGYRLLSAFDVLTRCPTKPEHFPPQEQSAGKGFERPPV